MSEFYEVKFTFLRLMHWVPGVLYEPVGRDTECLDAVLVMHSDEDYLDAPTGVQLAKRGLIKEFVVMYGCQWAVLSTDFELLAQQLREEHGISVTLHEHCHLCGTDHDDDGEHTERM